MSDPTLMSDALADARRSMIRTAPAEPDAGEVARARQDGMAAMMELRWGSTIPSRFVTASFDGISDVAARTTLEGWAVEIRPPNLVVLGPVGTGKTSAAVAAVRPAFDAMREVMFAPVHEMFDMLRPDGVPGGLGDLCGVDRLIIDDLGAERPSEWTTERLDLLVNRRWIEERPTVVTSNLNQRDLEERLGAHTASRLFGSGAVVVLMKGRDRRRSS